MHSGTRVRAIAQAFTRRSLIETFGACEEGGVGLVVADFGVEGRAVGLGDVGWVADYGVEEFVCG